MSLFCDMSFHNIFLILLVMPFQVFSLNYSSTGLKLNCPGRGYVYVILHVYGHTQEAWEDNFETGAGHRRVGDVEMIPFTNKDILLHRISTDSFGYIYKGEGRYIQCIKLSERPVHPTFG